MFFIHFRAECQTWGIFFEATVWQLPLSMVYGRAGSSPAASISSLLMRLRTQPGQP